VILSDGFSVAVKAKSKAADNGAGFAELDLAGFKILALAATRSRRFRSAEGATIMEAGETAVRGAEAGPRYGRL
jgi:hypothetical protein